MLVTAFEKAVVNKPATLFSAATQERARREATNAYSIKSCPCSSRHSLFSIFIFVPTIMDHIATATTCYTPGRQQLVCDGTPAGTGYIVNAFDYVMDVKPVYRFVIAVLIDVSSAFHARSLRQCCQGPQSGIFRWGPVLPLPSKDASADHSFCSPVRVFAIDDLSRCHYVHVSYH